MPYLNQLCSVVTLENLKMELKLYFTAILLIKLSIVTTIKSQLFNLDNFDVLGDVLNVLGDIGGMADSCEQICSESM